MDGMTWTREEVRELKRLRLDPIRNTPAKLRPLVEHFLKPGASVFAVTEGEGPVRVSKALARKVRDLTSGGALDWVVGEGPRKEDGPSGEPWAILLWRYPGEFVAAVAAYQGELEFEVQAKEIASGDPATLSRGNVCLARESDRRSAVFAGWVCHLDVVDCRPRRVLW